MKNNKWLKILGMVVPVLSFGMLPYIIEPEEYPLFTGIFIK